MAAFEVTLATHIATEVSGLTLGTNVFAGPVKPPSDNIPPKCVFVVPAGGSPPDGFCGETTVHKYISAQIRVRGDRGDYSDAISTARDVFSACHYADLTGYFDVRCEQSHPIYVGEDELGHPEFSINVELQIQEAA